MTRLYLRLIIPFAIVCLIFTLTARAIGTTQPPNPALRGFVEGCENKPQPCWFGIMPGVTTVEKAQYRLLMLGYHYAIDNWYAAPEGSNMCNVHLTFDKDIPAKPYIYSLEMNECVTMVLGDLMLGLGGVKGVLIGAGGGLFLKMRDTILIQTNAFDPGWKSPFIKFGSINILNEDPNSPEVYFKWHGFIPKWRYCQIEAVYRDYCRST
jgi:hypothetical protein